MTKWTYIPDIDYRVNNSKLLPWENWLDYLCRVYPENAEFYLEHHKQMNEFRREMLNKQYGQTI